MPGAVQKDDFRQAVQPGTEITRHNLKEISVLLSLFYNSVVLGRQNPFTMVALPRFDERIFRTFPERVFRSVGRVPRLQFWGEFLVYLSFR